MIHTPTITTKTITIRVLEVGDRKMTKAAFDQIQQVARRDCERMIIESQRSFKGFRDSVLLGWVYGDSWTSDPRNAYSDHVQDWSSIRDVWLLWVTPSGSLRRTLVSPADEDARCLYGLDDVNHLFIAT